MPPKIYGLTQKDRNAVKNGIVRAKNNPLGGRGAKTERRPQPNLTTDYNGYFKVINVSTGGFQKLMVTDGFADIPKDSLTAGTALINGTQFLDLASQEFIIIEDSWIYLTSEEGTTEPTEPVIEIFDSRQLYELGKSKTLISRVKFSSNIIQKFSQEVTGEIVGFIYGACE